MLICYAKAAGLCGAIGGVGNAAGYRDADSLAAGFSGLTARCVYLTTVRDLIVSCDDNLSPWEAGDTSAESPWPARKEDPLLEWRDEVSASGLDPCTLTGGAGRLEPAVVECRTLRGSEGTPERDEWWYGGTSLVRTSAVSMAFAAGLEGVLVDSPDASARESPLEVDNDPETLVGGTLSLLRDAVAIDGILDTAGRGRGLPTSLRSVFAADFVFAPLAWELAMGSPLSALGWLVTSDAITLDLLSDFTCDADFDDSGTSGTSSRFEDFDVARLAGGRADEAFVGEGGLTCVVSTTVGPW